MTSPDHPFFSMLPSLMMPMRRARKCWIVACAISAGACQIPAEAQSLNLAGRAELPLGQEAQQRVAALQNEALPAEAALDDGHSRANSPQRAEAAIQSTTNLADFGAASSNYAGKPYGGKVRQIPGIIQAEDYDVAPQGANGITFHYTGPVRNGNLRSTGDGIALARFGAGHVNIKGEPEKPDQVYVGWTETGQWMKYSVHVREPATYRLGGHFAAADKDATISVTFTPEIKTGPLAIPSTAGYQPGVEVYHVWETLTNLADIDLPAGDYIMTIKIENAGGMNIDYLSFTKKP